MGITGLLVSLKLEGEILSKLRIGHILLTTFERGIFWQLE